MINGSQKLTEIVTSVALFQRLVNVDVIEELAVRAELRDDVPGVHVLFLFRPYDAIA